MARAEPLCGLRGADEIAARIDALRADEAEPPWGAGGVALLARMLNAPEPGGRAGEAVR